MSIIQKVKQAFKLSGYEILDVRHGKSWIAFEFGSRAEAELAMPNFKPEKWDWVEILDIGNTNHVFLKAETFDRNWP